MLLKDMKVLLLDCQTTGASPQFGQILELGWMVADAHDPGRVETRLMALPDEEVLPARIKRLTGITDKDMQAALSPQTLLQELKSVLSEQAPVIAVAHYAQFERSFLAEFFADCDQSELPFSFLCTCKIAKRLFPSLPSRAIRALSGYLGQPMEEEKRSAGHVLATHFIWSRLVERLESDAACRTLEELEEWLRGPVPKAVAVTYDLPMERLKRLQLPARPGIYRMLSKTGSILYVGKATCLKDRVNSYFRGRKGKSGKTKELICQIHDLEVVEVETPLEAALLESDEIKKHNPPYNRALRSRFRALSFYNRDFSLCDEKQSHLTPLGPFVGEALVPLLELCKSIGEGSFSLELFWNLAELEIIRGGVELFLDNFAIASNEACPRRLLALGLSLYRRELNAELAQARQNLALADEIPDLTALDLLSEESEGEEVDDDEAEDEEEAVLDEEAVANMITGLTVSSARQYWQAKKLSRLLNSRLYFCDDEKWRVMDVENGVCQAHPIEEPLSLQRLGATAFVCPAQTVAGSSTQYPWAKLDLTTWDRMRVLSTELHRVAGGFLAERQLYLNFFRDDRLLAAGLEPGNKTGPGPVCC
ncbi:MAG: GIY-YIG nuclease family protein [Candidatus Melainabacteria bacterium]|nr:GIY-YIG nuclease family protein [Candidatus Melainabacteria bacterium]